MTVDVAELVDYRVQQAKAGLWRQNQDYGFQDVVALFLLGLLLLLVLVRVALDEEGDRIEDARVDTLTAIDDLFTLHHFICYLTNKILVFFFKSEVLF